MRFRVVDRMLAALSGLLIVLLGIALGLFGAGLFPAVNWSVLQGPFSIWQRVVIIAIALLLCLLGLHGLWMLFRRRADKGFIIQRTDLGDMSIAMSALSSMVNKCVDQHQEISVKKIRIHRIRDGIIVDLKILLANGINIPLTVNVLQKQIKQYITSCSGVDVHEVRVQIDTSDMPVEAKQEEAEAPAAEQIVAPVLLQDDPVVEVAAGNILKHTEEPADYVEPVDYAEPMEYAEPVQQTAEYEVAETETMPAEQEVVVPVEPMADEAVEPTAYDLPAEAVTEANEESYTEVNWEAEQASSEAVDAENQAAIEAIPPMEPEAEPEAYTDFFTQENDASAQLEDETSQPAEDGDLWMQVGQAFVRQENETDEAAPAE